MRYARQNVLPEIGDAGQAALAAARILVIGAGGLGSPALLYLTAAGVGLKAAGGCLGIVDDDTVALSNLQRQVLFTEADEGLAKAPAAASRLQALNGDTHIKVFETRLSNDNVLKIFGDFQIIIDGSDNFDTKYLINDAALRLSLPVVYGSILGFEGQAAVFWGKEGPCYRCLYPAQPQSHVPNCAEAGTLGGIAGMIGTIQAVEACKLALGLAHCHDHGLEPLLGKLLLTDARHWETQTLHIEKRTDCPVCGIAPDLIQLPQTRPQSCGPISLPMNLNDLQGLFESGIPFTLIDVREPQEWANGYLEGAMHIPLGRLLAATEILETLKSQEPVVVYCQHGIRSARAVRYLREHGFDAFDLLVDWSAL
jgi:sulfur-carrier protein adenylyltransferase/sulfurtransferase